LEVYERGMTTGVNASNRQLVAKYIKFTRDLPKWHQEIVMDPQTSGGLMVSVKQDQAEDLLAELHKNKISQSAVIGRVKPKEENFIVFI
ncbi:AIR synthase-related protein, partial [Desulfobacterales bacterium HSG17]|nr:AIR synthase-related protein [Desulfobacterales bacterium HSG17]